MLAPAKINLSLFIKGKREDGYHELESLVTFADIGDEITYEFANEYKLTITGELIDGDQQDNLILKAARFFKEVYPSAPFLHFYLKKFLPVASGLGGGSSDAATALRILASLVSGSDPMHIARKLGADVPVCLYPKTRKIFGIGHDLGDEINIKPLYAMLVNPRIAVSTAEVFRRITHYTPSPPHENHNDMEVAAIKIAPVIGEILADLKALRGAREARMSGSGATCFAIFENESQRDESFKSYAQKRDTYWVKKANLGLEYSSLIPISIA